MTNIYETTIVVKLLTKGTFNENTPENWTLRDIHRRLAYGPGRGTVEVTESVPVDIQWDEPEYMVPPTYCDVCGMPFTLAEWDVRHTPDDDPLAEVHDHCCPNCERIGHE